MSRNDIDIHCMHGSFTLIQTLDAREIDLGFCRYALDASCVAFLATSTSVTGRLS